MRVSGNEKLSGGAGLGLEFSHALEQDRANPLEPLVDGVDRGLRVGGELLDRKAIPVVPAEYRRMVRRQLLHALAQPIVSRLKSLLLRRLLGLKFFQQRLVGKQVRAAGVAGGVLSRLVEGEADRPGEEGPCGVVPVKLLPQRERRLLEDVPSVLWVGQDRRQVAENIPVRRQEEAKKLPAVVGRGRTFHA
jgi:hypothetical protein